MATLIQPLNKVLNVIRTINEGNDMEALASLNLKPKSKSNQKPVGESFLEKIASIQESKDYHNGSILITGKSKADYTKDAISENLDIIYSLTEDTSMITAGSIGAFLELSENINPILTPNGSNNIRTTFNEGLNIIGDYTYDVFSSIHNMSNLISSIVNESISSSKYRTLAENALAGVNELIEISKTKEFTSLNNNIISEANNLNDINRRADDILFNTLDLQENLIKHLHSIHTFNNSFTNSISESANKLKSLSDYMQSTITKVAIPISEGMVVLKSKELREPFNNAVCSIASLYDEYIQDYLA